MNTNDASPFANSPWYPFPRERDAARFDVDLADFDRVKVAAEAFLAADMQEPITTRKAAVLMASELDLAIQALAQSSPEAEENQTLRNVTIELGQCLRGYVHQLIERIDDLRRR